MNQSVKPLMKYPGGKSYRLSLIRELLEPFPCERYRYCEPMVGAGAIFFGVGHRFRSRVISDINPELINLYETVRDDVEALISELRNGSYYFVRKEEAETLANYRRIRDWSPDRPVQQAARMVYLAATCFNGLSRTNQRGKFNAAPGSYENPTICDAERLRSASLALAGAAIGRPDAAALIRRLPDRPTLLVVDPPYDYDREGKVKFTGYYDRFTQQHHARLVRAMLQSGHRFIYFNRATPFIRDLFLGSGARLHVLPLRHSIQQKYTQSMVEEELIAHNLPVSPGRGAPPVTPQASETSDGAGDPLDAIAWQGYRPLPLRLRQHEALAAIERSTGLPAEELARRAIDQFLANAEGRPALQGAGTSVR